MYRGVIATSKFLRVYRHKSYSMSAAVMESKETSSDGFIEIIEGSAKMNYDKNEAVFYNKVQVFNRDISIQTIRLFSKIRQRERQEKYEKKMEKFRSHPDTFEHEPFPPTEGITILDALAATGLRSVRYLKEIPGVNHVTINDLLPAAVDAAEVNCKHNGVDSSRVTLHHGDACMYMYEHREPLKNFDVIDLDPYGTASPFLDSAVQAVADGGLLCVTCTDMPTLSGNYPDVCYAKYGCMPLKARFVHEMSLRILLHAIDATANKYKRHIVPWLSLSVDFYVRVFVRVFESPAEVKRSALKRCMIYQSTQCPAFYVQPVGSVSNGSHYSAPAFSGPAVCEETGSKLKVGGPFWGDPIHNQEIVDELLRTVESGEAVALGHPIATSKRIVGILTAISEEVKDAPMYYLLPDLAATVRSKCPSITEFYSAIINCGYQVSQFHHEPLAVKTNAPSRVVWDIMRRFCQLNPPVGSVHKKTADSTLSILAREIITAVDFSVPENDSAIFLVPSVNTAVTDLLLLQSLQRGRKQVTRFAPNPEANWGPKQRAGRLIKDKEKDKVQDSGLGSGNGKGIANSEKYSRGGGGEGEQGGVSTAHRGQGRREVGGGSGGGRGRNSRWPVEGAASSAARVAGTSEVDYLVGAVEGEGVGETAPVPSEETAATTTIASDNKSGVAAAGIAAVDEGTKVVISSAMQETQETFRKGDQASLEQPAEKKVRKA